MGRPTTSFVLPAADRAALETFTQTGCRSVPAAGVSRQTVGQVRQRYEQAGVAATLAEAPRSGAPRRFDGPARAALTALACTQAPVGHSR